MNQLFAMLLEYVSSLQDMVSSGQIAEILNTTNQTEIDEYKELVDMLDEYTTVGLGKE